MMKMKINLRKFLVVCSTVLLCLPATWSLAGNKKMVEKEVAELDATNKQVISELPDLPVNGQVNVKARFHGERGDNEVEILQSDIIADHTAEAPQTQQQTIEFK